MDEWANIGVLGASSFVGECLIARLKKEGRRATAFSRSPSNRKSEPGVSWLQLPVPSSDFSELPPVKDWVCVAPIWVLPQYFRMIEAHGARRVVAVSSTSLFVKTDSSDHGEQDMARRLGEGEHALRAWAVPHGVEWVIVRPTLIYGRGRDKNVTEIARFVRRWGFFPLLGHAAGLRQPVHVDDVAAACVSALTVPAAANHTYDISGEETLSYRDIVCRVFNALDKSPHLMTVPRWLFRLAVETVRLLPQYKHWTVEMADRMNRDLVFDHADAARDLGFSPRSFRLSPEDLPA